MLWTHKSCPQSGHIVSIQNSDSIFEPVTRARFMDAYNGHAKCVQKLYLFCVSVDRTHQMCTCIGLNLCVQIYASDYGVQSMDLATVSNS